MPYGQLVTGKHDANVLGGRNCQTLFLHILATEDKKLNVANEANVVNVANGRCS
jgi:hypothetical protein